MCIFDDTCKRDNKNETITCNFELMIQFCNAVTATYFTATYNYSLSILIKTKWCFILNNICILSLKDYNACFMAELDFASMANCCYKIII